MDRTLDESTLEHRAWPAPHPDRAPCPPWTVALTNDFGHHRNNDFATTQALAACRALPDPWRGLVVRRAMSASEL